MPGTLAAAGLVVSAALLTGSLAGVSAAAVFGQRLAGVADAAALAAADAASGAVTGVPCERAREITQRGEVELTACELDGLVATVSVSAPFGVLVAVARARAGPPS
ncbi:MULTISPECIES: Rv3654c family TadE-like protein [Microbacterium]|uniref:Rv3654c family TadE-like protein n=1 Tax=Microbacterium TaxID=33882 RepID=UPI00146AC77B|nr:MULTISPECIES: Rv3654c family TadE-like protein [Microbacterium]